MKYFTKEFEELFKDMFVCKVCRKTRPKRDESKSKKNVCYMCAGEY